MWSWFVLLTELQLAGMAVLWMMLATVLYLDDPEQRKKVRRHCASIKILSIKFAFPWVTIAYVLGVITSMPVRVLYRNFAIGCVTGRQMPQERWRPEEREMSVREAVLRNTAALREGQEQGNKNGFYDEVQIDDEFRSRYDQKAMA